MNEKKEPIPMKQEPKKKTTSGKRAVEIMFKQNRKFDLHIGREMVTFRGRETKKVPKKWIDHKDFESVKQYFVIKGDE